jgi:hypothetical protein
MNIPFINGKELSRRNRWIARLAKVRKPRENMKKFENVACG